MANVGHYSATALVGSGSSPALDALAADVKSIKTDIGTVKSNTSEINSTVTTIGTKLDAVQEDVAVIKAQTAPVTE